jgi:hypothetical protein
MSNTASNGGREVANDHVGIAVRRARRGARWVVVGGVGRIVTAVRRAGRRAVSAALVNSGRGRALVDVSGQRVTWPGSRLVQFGADAALARSLATQRVSETVPVAPDETAARQLLDRRPRVLVRHLDLEQPRSARLRAGSFVSRLVSA